MSFLGVSFVEFVVEVAELAEQLGYWLVYGLDVCPDMMDSRIWSTVR
jgi:hypothetical protein